MKYRKRPVVIEAEQVTQDNLESLADWCRGVIRQGLEDWSRERWLIEIETLEGHMSARIGDYIIQGVQGEFYPCRADIFAATYEQVAE